MPDVVLSDRQAGVRRLTMNRPERRNALNSETIFALKDALTEAARDPDSRVVVLTGAGGAFSSGADLGGGGSKRSEGSDKVPAGDVMEDGFNAVIRAIWNVPKPVIAAVDGVAAGFGCSLSLACDVRLASATSRFSLIFVQRALTIDGGASYLLPRLAGLKGIELALTGEVIPAQEAERIGLVNRVIPEGEFSAYVTEYAQKMAKQAPLALAAIKTSLHHALGRSLDEVLTYEMAEQRKMVRTADFREGLAAFLEKREPNYTGR
jgi:2-(1,2-epoxy-1,2-dihydrophenyl)acetyl-CoA isomerase